jgi:hypothetical protein
LTNSSCTDTSCFPPIDWEAYARLTSTVERKEFIEACLADPAETARKFVRRFLQPPLHNTQYEKAFGTLYTAVYDPGRLTAEYHWPHRAALRQSFADFDERRTVINLKLTRPSDMTDSV